MIPRVADNGVARLGECGLDLAGDRRVERREHELGRTARRCRIDRHAADGVHERRRQPPRGRVAVRFALGTLTRAEPGHTEPWMGRQQRDELLTDHARCAENPDIDHDRVIALFTFAAGVSSVNDAPVILPRLGTSSRLDQ